jgi:hypothetical protein
MLVRCPRCAAPREVAPQNDPGTPRACEQCGYTGAAAPLGNGMPRDSLPSFAGARARLKDATQDLFRLTGGHSIPVEMSVPAPPAAAPPSEPSSGRKAEASIMFSLEELMKAANPASDTKRDEVADQQLWSMQSATPLFGTSHDQALLTTPLQPLQTSATDSMTVPSRPYARRRRWPLLLGAGGGSLLLLGAAGFWLGVPHGPAADAAPSSEVRSAIAVPSSAPEQLALSALPPAEGVPGDVAVPAVPPAVEPAALGAPAASAPPAAAEAGEVAVATPSAAAEPAVAVKDPRAQTLRSARQGTKKPAPRASVPTTASLLAPFDTGAARDALNAASAKAAECSQSGSASGKGKVQLTFATTGRVSSASIVEGPFSGTASGNCALRHFRSAHVPPFAGTPQTVAKSFKIP